MSKIYYRQKHIMEPLKHVYNKLYFKELTKDIKAHYPSFNTAKFTKKIFDKDWDNKELKDRMRHISHCINDTLNLPYPKAIEVLKKVSIDRGGFESMFFPDYVEVYGLDEWKTSMDAMAHFTKYSSSEFAIRPFILKDSKKGMKQMLKWSKDKNHHVRRLASEGCRPRLPWAVALPEFKKDPSLVIPILENLKNDESEYVRRSVANNLNDISKDHPALVLKIAKEWLGKTKETDKLIKHACRTLLKQGNTKAMTLFGFANPKNIEIQNLQTTKKTIKIGDDLHFNFEINNLSKKGQVCRVEYAIDYLKKLGKYSKKVFKITENTYPSGNTHIQKKQSFKNFSTRTHYAGTHHVAIIINGVEKAKVSFEVK